MRAIRAARWCQDTGSAIGILVEAVLTRLSTPIGQGKPATNVLYAVPIDAALSQLGLAAAQEPTPRCVQFEEALRESYSRCVAQWQALGVPRATADELAHDPAVGDFPSELRPHADSPLRIVVGDIGSGKSLGAIRFFQQALRDATTSTSAPIPVFLHTADLSGDLSRDIALKCAGLGDPKSRGSRICIDITEGVGFAIGDLLLQARTIAGAWHNTLVLISSRPSAALDDAEETRRLGALSEAEVESLLTRTLGRPLRFNLMEKLSEPVKSAIQRPLFALLLSTYLRAHDTHVPRSVGELITDLVERSFQLSKLTESMQQASLYRLARQISDNGGKPVPSREFAARTVVDELLRSHLVVERNRLLSFSDPLFLHWFAAQALLADPGIVGILCEKPRHLESWKYPLAIAIAQASILQAAAIFQPLIAADIVFAVEVLRTRCNELERAGRGALYGYRGLRRAGAARCGEPGSVALGRSRTSWCHGATIASYGPLACG